ncbi:MAG TPA: hypothetical protein VH251_00325 [Verrucomicrobiae bacterium]|jgi:hypothetical protein|nr:hypothetical protein [Verrucomicrobiae bacterium]
MMDDELDKLEAGLRRIPPTAAPPELMERLRAARTKIQPKERRVLRRVFRWSDLFAGWRGLALGSAAAVLLLGWLILRPMAGTSRPNSSVRPVTTADTVQVGHSLMASFDAVAQLPGGEAVRFRCREWQDDVVIHDKVNGVVISQSTPRVELVPVRFETY